MAAIAASTSEQTSAGQRPQRLWSIVHSPTVAAAMLSGVIALVSAVYGPMRAGAMQNQQKKLELQLELRTNLATDMSKSFTVAVAAGQRVASGLIYGPTGNRARNAAAIQDAYNYGLGQWQIDGSRIMAELSARYPGTAIAHEWAMYRLAVTRFYRLSAVLPPGERHKFISTLRAYFKHMRATPWASRVVPRESAVEWQALERERGFRRSPRYRRTYDRVSASFLSLGDAFVAEMLKLRPQI
jgi:hypothetical protein